MKSLASNGPVALAVAAGAATPVPADGAGATIWSSTASALLVWNGSSWAAIGGGSGAPGGATTQLQFNDGGAFGGDADLTWDKTGNVLLTNGVHAMQEIADPAAPAAGIGRFYARNWAGRTLPWWKGPSGVSYALSPHWGENNIRGWKGGNGTTASVVVNPFGSLLFTAQVPVAATLPALAATNVLTQTKRTTMSTGTTAGGITFIRSNQTEVWRGNAAGLGGFLAVFRFALSALQTGQRAFAGLVDVIASPTNIDPTTTTAPGGIGLAINASTGNWNLVNNVTGTARTVLALGASFPVNTTDLLELALWCSPNGGGVSYQVTNLSTGATTSGTLTTNIPASATFLAPSIWLTNNATAAAATFDLVSVYLETDY